MWDIKIFRDFVARISGGEPVQCSVCGKEIKKDQLYFCTADTDEPFCIECFGPDALVCDLSFADGDLKLVEGPALDKQDIISRALTDAPDWYYYPELGANLSELRGEPNIPRTAVMGKEQLLGTLTYDNRFSRDGVYIRPVPVSQNSIVFYVLTGEAETAIPIEVGS